MAGFKKIKIKHIFILPTVLILFAFGIFPAVASLLLSFTNFSLAKVGEGFSFVGLTNYLRLFSDARFILSMRNTFIYVILGVGFQYIVGMFLAMLIYEETKINKFYRVVFLIPIMLTPVAIGYTWRMMLHGTYGPINHLLSIINLPGIPWLSSTIVAPLTIMLVDFWQWTPFMILALLAGRMSISPEYYEAAGVDGASKAQVFAYITFPILLPVSLTVILIRAIEVAKIVDIIYVLTGGGPGVSTESITLYGYISGVKQFNLGYASSIAYTILVAIMVFGFIFLRLKERFK
ncbi:MAG: sugar ABC transporter permease [Actinobacteria bacterium]|nr:sugar ABC transporter permease [Actinomycetota bacterium]